MIWMKYSINFFYLFFNSQKSTKIINHISIHFIYIYESKYKKVNAKFLLNISFFLQCPQVLCKISNISKI